MEEVSQVLWETFRFENKLATALRHTIYSCRIKHSSATSFIILLSGWWNLCLCSIFSHGRKIGRLSGYFVCWYKGNVAARWASLWWNGVTWCYMLVHCFLLSRRAPCARLNDCVWDVKPSRRRLIGCDSGIGGCVLVHIKSSAHLYMVLKQVMRPEIDRKSVV